MFKRGDIIQSCSGVKPIVLITNVKKRHGILLPINASAGLEKYVNVESQWASFSHHKWSKMNPLKLALSGVTSQQIEKFLDEYSD